MRIAIDQIYIEFGIRFPFNHLMQNRISDKLSSTVEMSDRFRKKYGADYYIRVGMSAKTAITENEIRGPIRHKKANAVMYTLFLPFDVIVRSPRGCACALEFLLAGIRTILERLAIDVAKLDARKDAIIESICSDQTMFDGPWPARAPMPTSYM